MKQLIYIFLFAVTQVNAQMPKHQPRPVSSSASSITYATYNPLDMGTHLTLSNGNLTVTGDGDAAGHLVRSTIGKSSGKWYWENVINTSGIHHTLGIATAAASLNAQGIDNDAFAWTIGIDGWVHNNGGASNYTSAFGTSVVGCALDMDGLTFKIYVSNVLVYSTSIVAGTYYGCVISYFSADNSTTNFGATTLTYSPPAGYNAGLY